MYNLQREELSGIWLIISFIFLWFCYFNRFLAGILRKTEPMTTIAFQFNSIFVCAISIDSFKV